MRERTKETEREGGWSDVIVTDVIGTPKIGSRRCEFLTIPFTFRRHFIRASGGRIARPPSAPSSCVVADERNVFRIDRRSRSPRSLRESLAEQGGGRWRKVRAARKPVRYNTNVRAIYLDFFGSFHFRRSLRLHPRPKNIRATYVGDRFSFYLHDDGDETDERRAVPRARALRNRAAFGSLNPSPRAREFADTYTRYTAEI